MGEASKRAIEPLNSMSLEELSNNTVLLLRAMRYKCDTSPSKLMLTDSRTSLAGFEMIKWKRKLEETFNVEGKMKTHIPQNRQTQVDIKFEED